MQIDFGGGDEILFYKRGLAAIIHLNRPKALNALSYTMIKALHKALDHFLIDDDVACVIVEGEGRAFCAGGDVVSVYKSKQQGTIFYDYFFEEYALNAKIGRFPKPYISLLNGIVMGGGAGISIHGSYRIVTENTIFAMPESAIGFFSDIGSGAFLSKLKDNFGKYLALTGNHCKWGDCLQYGLATHAVSEHNIEQLKNTIIEQGNPLIALKENAIHVDFETSQEIRSCIQTCFGKQTVEECLEYLANYSKNGDIFAKNCLDVLKSRSPTSLKVIWRYIKECIGLSLDACLEIDKRIAYKMLKSHDFYEGVRAVLVDKDKNPKWQPQQVENISPSIVDAYFQPIKNHENVNV